MELLLGWIIGQTQHPVSGWAENFEFSDRLIPEDACAVPHFRGQCQDGGCDLFGGRWRLLGGGGRQGQDQGRESDAEAVKHGACGGKGHV
ncbi:MAG TPA: hypothetical protein VGE27_17560 [Gemmatimonas sp.]|uniref:hypothetical protein n=1 Tax=Gemmatimonas sp. TaxID=1962908 RepID=UPI002ED79EFC